MLCGAFWELELRYVLISVINIIKLSEYNVSERFKMKPV